MQSFRRGSVAPAGDTAAAFGPSGRGDADRAALLLRTIEAEIIPRLMLAHRAPLNDEQPTALPAQPTPDEQVVELTEIVLRRDTLAALSYVQARRAAGVSVEQIYLDLLGPVAQRLGALWEADQCDFTQVTVGLWRLQQILHEHSASFQRGRPKRAPLRQALLMTAPGTQHTFGLLIVGEFFRRAGWQVGGDPTLALDAALNDVATRHVDVIGLSVGSECHVDALASAILALRKASLNRAVVVMVGGPVVALQSDFVERVGADATAPNAAAAVSLAEQLVAQRAAPA